MHTSGTLALGLLSLSTTCLWAQGTPGTLDDQRWLPRYDLFQLLMEENSLQTQTSFGEILSAPQSSVLVMASENGFLPAGLRSDRVHQFVKQGGAAVIMLEMANNLESRLPWIGTLANGPVRSFTSADLYRPEFDDCLKITTLDDPDGWFPGVKSLVTNRGDYFLPEFSAQMKWHTFAAYSESTHPLASRGKALIAIARPSTVGHETGSVDNQGLLIFIADSSLLTNGMLWHGDNAKFALRLAELFKGQRRSQLIFFERFQVLAPATERLAQRLRDEQARLNMQNMPRPEPSLERMLRLGNAIAKEVVSSNVLNEALAKQPRNIRPELYFRFLIGALLLSALGWAFWKLLTSRQLRELWLSRRRMRYVYEIVSGNEGGDYRTAAGYLAREFCIQWTGSQHSRDWQQALGVLLMRSPSITPEDRRQLTRIVDIASRGCHENMATKEFQNFGRTLATLRRFTAVYV